MSKLPSVQQVAPIAPVKKSSTVVVIPLRERKVISQSAQQDWQDVLTTRSELLNETTVLPEMSERQQQDSGNSEQGKDEQDRQHAAPLSKTQQEVHAQASGAASPIHEETLPLNMNRLGGLIAAFVVNSVVHGSWAVQIPLAHELLKETVLHMRCEQAMLTLRFETSDWNSRETLMQHAPTLLRRLRQSLPQLLDVILVTD